jgi:LAO/AO transport system kinase
MTEEPDIDALAAAVAAGDRRALARAVTLVESTRPDHRAAARRLATGLATGLAAGARPALRVGLTGTPGVGKSTFIEALGLRLTAGGLRVAVLAVDPSSARSGGAILGDKTRMARLSREPRAFIRPSPSQGTLGGVARRTREVIGLCEAAGFDVVLVETVGVGQSETLVADLCDVFVLLIAPAGGDELQGVKRGIMERADLILVTKADGALAAAAELTRADYGAALRLLRRRDDEPEGFPQALTVSALTGAGLAAAWAAVEAIAAHRTATGLRAARRQAQAVAAFRAELEAGLLAWATARPGLAAAAARLEAAVREGRIAPDAAAAALLAELPG